MPLKQCRYCGEMKEEDLFEKGRGNTITNRCKACAAKYHRKQYQDTERRKKLLLRGRVNSLRKFCEANGLTLSITVTKGEEQWI